MMRAWERRCAVVALGCAASLPLWGQAAAVPVIPAAYDVASVRVNKSGSNNMMIDSNDTSFKAQNVRLKTLLANAYDIREGQISGLPGWADSVRFDLSAKLLDMDPEAAKKLTDAQRNTLLAGVLADRFGLKAHHETKIQAVYELVVDKGGPRFKESTAEKGPDAKPDADGMMRGSMKMGRGELTAVGLPIANLTYSLAGQVERSVIDKTGLKGEYDFHLKWTPGMSGEDESGPGLFAALQEQLGLKLQAAKGPVETLVVDEVKMPTEN